MNEKRIIKFRAWDGKKWQYGTYYYGVMYPTSFMGHYVNDEQIDENTLGQFTGLLDGKGKEIYEGDIVKTAYGVGKIDYYRCEFTIRGEGNLISVNALHNQCSLVSTTCNNLEIIGNIYENSNLLKI